MIIDPLYGKKTYAFKQGCLMAQILFRMIVSAMLTYALQDCDAGFPTRYCFAGILFNLRRLQAKTKVQNKRLHVDDTVDNAKTQTKMQGSMARVLQACNYNDITISTRKTED